MSLCVLESVSLSVYLEDELISLHPRSASSVRDLDQHKCSQSLIPPSAVPTKPHTVSIVQRAALVSIQQIRGLH